MSLQATLGVGLLLGMRHAVDPDHLVVVTALLKQERGRLAALRTAVIWGLGHSIAFFGVGLSIIALGLRVPAAWERLAEALVASMLVGLGALQILESAATLSPPLLPRGRGLRPAAAGFVHGLAGSAGVSLLALSTLQSPRGALLYLAAFAVGTIVGMGISTTLVSFPLSAIRRAPPAVSRLMYTFAGFASVCFGLILFISLIVRHEPGSQEDHAGTHAIENISK